MADRPTYEDLEQRIKELEKERQERGRAQEKLRESEYRYRSFLQNYSGIAFRGNMDFEPVFCHGAVESITGYTVEELVSGKLAWEQIIHPEDLPGIAESMARIRSTPKYSAEMEYRILRKDGETRWVHEVVRNVCDESGSPQFVEATICDITARKQAETAFRDQTALLETVLRQAADGIVLCDKEGHLTFVNAAAWLMARLNPERMSLDTASAFWGETRDAEGHVIVAEQWPLAKALRGEITVGGEVEMIRRDGSCSRSPRVERPSRQLSRLRIWSRTHASSRSGAPVRVANSPYRISSGRLRSTSARSLRP